jgi:hypothetical protein
MKLLSRICIRERPLDQEGQQRKNSLFSSHFPLRLCRNYYFVALNVFQGRSFSIY